MTKLRFLFIGFFLALVAILVKLFFIQVILANSIVGNNYLRTSKIAPIRGAILDRNGNQLVFNQLTYRLFAEPRKIENKDEVIDKLESVLHIGEATISAKIKTDKAWISIVNGLSKKQKDEVEKLKLKFIGFDDESSRFYPESSLSAHLVGFVGKNEDSEDIGYFGLEGFYDKELAGLSGILRTERDLFGNPIVIGLQALVEGENGRELTTTIDKTVQYISKEKLKAGMEKYRAKEGCVIVANPDTMELLSMVCLPDFDPKDYGKHTNDIFKNPIVSNLYEPGSIFKPLIVAAALNERSIKPNETFEENGPVTLGGYKIETWDKKYEGEISMTRILEKSSNVGMVYIGKKMGEEKILTYMDKFGFGEKTSVDVQGEVSGYIKPKKSWYPIDYMTATFGQGVVVTPLQMITAFSSIINGGKRMQPYVVSQIGNGIDAKKIKPKQIEQVIDERSSLLIREMLRKTVENAEAKWDKPKGYKIGGKTGTAQVAIEGKYDPTKTLATFVGFAPVDKPKFIVLVMYKEPQSSPWGSETAAPTFFEIASELLVYYNMAPEQ